MVVFSAQLSQFVARWSLAYLSSPLRLLIDYWQKCQSEPLLSIITNEMKMHFILTVWPSLLNSSPLNFHNSLCLCFCFRIKRNTWTPSTTTWRSTALCTVPARCTFPAMWRTTAFWVAETCSSSSEKPRWVLPAVMFHMRTIWKSGLVLKLQFARPPERNNRFMLNVHIEPGKCSWHPCCFSCENTPKLCWVFMQLLVKERDFKSCKCFLKVTSIISFGTKEVLLTLVMSASSGEKGEGFDFFDLWNQKLPVRPGTEGGVGGQRHQTGARQTGQR